MQPFFEDVQSHYDLSDEFFALFLDPTRTYSCAYFNDPNATLEEAQRAKIDLSLGKLHLSPGMKLLDIGCGWGATALRAAEHYQANVIGLTLSENQYQSCDTACQGIRCIQKTSNFACRAGKSLTNPSTGLSVSVPLNISGIAGTSAFFKRCREILPADGIMMLHSIVTPSMAALRESGIEFCHEDISFARFIRDEIFPGGQLCAPERIKSLASQNGFDVYHVQSLRLHYARTLDCWARKPGQIEGAGDCDHLTNRL